jgi:hypothetical protein
MKDFEEITAAAYDAYPRARLTRWGYLLVGTALVFLPFLAGGSVFDADWSLLAFLGYAALFIYAGTRTPRRTARKQYRNLIFPYEYEAEISPDGIVTTSPTVRTDLKWAAFSRAIEAPEVVALVYESVMYVFPRRAFAQEQWQEFIGMIKERVPAKT